MENDILEFDYDEIMKLVTEGRTILGQLVSSSNNTIDKLIELQEVVHDIDGSKITEDYKDYAVLYGNGGMKAFIETLEEAFDDIEDSANELYKIANM